MAPARFTPDGWIAAGTDGVMDETYELPGNFEQLKKPLFTFENTGWAIDWCCLRRPAGDNYLFSRESLTLRGSDTTLDGTDPTFIALRQKGFDFDLGVDVSLDRGEAGVSAYISENEHYDLFLCKRDSGLFADLKLNIGPVKHLQCSLPLSPEKARLIFRGSALTYSFYVVQNGSERCLGSAETKYLSSEVSSGHTSTMLGLYAVEGNTAVFRSFALCYKS